MAGIVSLTADTKPRGNRHDIGNIGPTARTAGFGRLVSSASGSNRPTAVVHDRPLSGISISTGPHMPVPGRPLRDLIDAKPVDDGRAWHSLDSTSTSTTWDAFSSPRGSANRWTACRCFSCPTRRIRRLSARNTLQFIWGAVELTARGRRWRESGDGRRTADARADC